MITLPDTEMNGTALANNKPQQTLQKPRINTQLTIFREIVGINPTPALGFGNSKRPAQNEGIYRRTCQAESKARLQYYACAATFNTCFLLQIVVAAALTAIGAAKGPHIAVTVLGAINTVIAGVLTYLKGQGLPNRLRQYQGELRKVREYIEERERDFSRLDCKLDLDHEIAIIWRMYEAVRQNNEDNFPDTYHNFTGANGAKPAETQTPPAKQMNAIPVEKATANGKQVEVSAIEVPPGLSDRSSNRNSVHLPVDGDGNWNGKRSDLSGEHPRVEKTAAWERQPLSMDIEPAATGEYMSPYAGLRHMHGAIPSGRPASSTERSPNRQSRHVSTERPAVSKERPNSMTGRRTSVEIPSGPIDGSSHRNTTYEPPTPSGRPSNRNSLYILRPLPTAPNESVLSFDNPDVPTNTNRAPSASSTNGNMGLAVPSRRNSTTPVKQFYTAAQRKG